MLKSRSKDGFDYPNFSMMKWVIIGLLIALFFSETAFAQFGGKSGAPSGSVVSGNYNPSDRGSSVSDSSVLDSSALEASSFSSGSNPTSPASNGEAKIEIEKSDYESIYNMLATGKDVLSNRRQRYFIKKLRLEFAARETIERAAGIAVSWTRVGLYLRDLDNELIAVEQSGEEANRTFIAGMAQDLNLIEATLDDHIDKALFLFAKKNSKRSSYVIKPLLPQSSAGLRVKMRALAEKSELVDFSTKALQAMGHHLAN